MFQSFRGLVVVVEAEFLAEGSRVFWVQYPFEGKTGVSTVEEPYGPIKK